MTLRWLLLFLPVTALYVPPSSGHSVSYDYADFHQTPTRAALRVEQDKLRLSLVIDAADAAWFPHLFETLAAAKGSATQRQHLRRFCREEFRILDANGRPLTARLAGHMTGTQPQPTPDTSLQPAAATPEAREMFVVELIYRLTGRPSVLTVVPPSSLTDAETADGLAFVASHQGMLINEPGYLHERETLRLDWQDPWHSRFVTGSLGRAQQSFMSYLYIEPYEIRHEMLVRVRDLAQPLGIDLAVQQAIEADDWESLLRRAGKLLRDTNPLNINGQPVEVIVDQSVMVQVSPSAVKILDKPRSLKLNGATIGVTLAYFTEGLPERVSIDWRLFTEKVRQVPAVISAPGAAERTERLTPEQSGLVWTNELEDDALPSAEALAVAEDLTHLKLPLGTLLCLLLLLPFVWHAYRAPARLSLPTLSVSASLVVAAIALLPYWQISLTRPVALAAAASVRDDQARTLVHALLRNIYRAFDLRHEQDVYDKLALTVDGRLLAEIYLQQRRSLVVQQAGGAQVKVKNVELQAATLRPSAGHEPSSRLVFDTEWLTSGSVGHWGHKHSRTNKYSAVIAVDAVDGIWKIVDLDMLGEERIDSSAPLGRR